MLDELIRRYHLWVIDRSIHKHGFTIIYVPGDADQPSLAYSVGFQSTLGAPEIVTFGVDQPTANGLFWTAFHGLKSGDLSIGDGVEWDLGMGPERRLAWRGVHPTQILREHFNVAIMKAEKRGEKRSDMRVWQLVFSDTAGRLPWESDFDVNYRPSQPQLWKPYLGPPDED